MSRTRNSVWNIGAGLIYALVSALASLFATPWLLHWLGTERVGAFKAITDWMGYLTFFELGMGGTMMAALAIRIGQDDRAAVSSMLVEGVRLYSRIIVASLACGIGLVIALPHVIPAGDLNPGELRWTGAVTLLSLLLSPLLVYRALADARQRSYINWLLLTLQVLLTTALSLVLARSGWGLIGQGLAWTVAQVPVVVILACDGLRTYRWNALSDREDRKELLSLTWPTFIHMMAERIGLLSDYIVIAWIFGPAALAPFYLTQQLVVIVQYQLRGLSGATWAGLVDLYSHGESARFHQRLLELTCMVSGLGLAVLGPIVAYNRSFIQFWVGQELYAGDAVTILSCFNILLWSIYILWGWMLLGTGHIRRWVPYSIVATLVNISVSLLCTFTLGFVGPLIGSATALLLVISWALPHVLRLVFGISPWAIWRAALIPLRWGLPYLAVMWAVAHYTPPQNWAELITWMAIWTVGGVILWWKLSLGKGERREWWARLRSIFQLSFDV